MRKSSCETYIAGGKVVDKDSNYAWFLGTVDEANAFIGLAKVFVKDSEIKKTLAEAQRKMFILGSEHFRSSLSDEDFQWMTEKIEELEKAVKKPKNFIILEKDEGTAFLSVARAVVRRAERIAVRLYREGLIRIEAVEWLNRLNYLLYLMILKEGGGEFEKA